MWGGKYIHFSRLLCCLWLHSQYIRGFWCLGDATITHGTDLFIKKYSSRITRKVSFINSGMLVMGAVTVLGNALMTAVDNTSPFHARVHNMCVGNQSYGILVQNLMAGCNWQSTLQWRHNGLDGVSNHRPHHYLLSRLFGRRSKKTSKLRVTDLCAGNSPGTGEFPAQMASNAENVSIRWRHHEIVNTVNAVWLYWVWRHGNVINIVLIAHNVRPILRPLEPPLVSLTHSPLMPHICVSESGQYWFS